MRALLVVRLTGGYAVTYSVWAGVHPGDLQHAFRIWWAPEYENLRRDGALANRSLRGDRWQPRHPGSERSGPHAPLREQLRPMLSRVLGEEWSLKDVLETLP